MDSLKLNTRQRRRLRRQLRATRDARTYRRTLAILEVDRGRSVRDVAISLGVEPRTIYYWIEAYLRDHDPAALADAEHPGRPSLWAEGLGRRLRAAMALSPQDLGYPSVDWTVPLLRDYLDDQGDGRPSDETIRRGLRRLGYVWKRPRYVLDPDPELEKKTADPPHHPAAAAPDRPPGRGRDRSAALPAAPSRLGAAG
jgi:transposase